jgi:hypothetical protein
LMNKHLGEDGKDREVRFETEIGNAKTNKE